VQFVFNTFGTPYQITWGHISEACSWHSQRRENVMSDIS